MEVTSNNMTFLSFLATKIPHLTLFLGNLTAEGEEFFSGKIYCISSKNELNVTNV